MQRLFILFSFCFICSQSFSVYGQALPQTSNQPRAYYVSTSGRDDNAGTRTRPFKSISRINRLVFSAGDTLCFRSNEEFLGSLKINLAATAEKPFVITSYGGGRANLNGGQKEALVFQGAHLVLKNINAKGWGRKGGNSTDGIRIKGEDIYIEGVKTEGFQKSGLELSDCTGAVVKKVTARYNGFSGIHVIGSMRSLSRNIIIQDCTTANNPGDPTNLTNHSGNGILVGFSDSVLIDHCTATNNGWDMPRKGNGPVGIWTYESNRVTIQYCISYRNRTAKGAKDGGGFDFDGGMTNSVMQYCLSYENEGAGYGLFQYNGASPWRNNMLRYCISINDATSTEGSGSIFMWSGDPDTSHFSDCLVYQNLVYNAVATAVQFEQESFNKGFFFYNNIFIGSGKIIDGPSSGERFAGNVWWTFKGNIRFRDYASLNQWADSTGQEKWNGQLVGKQVNPLLHGPFITRLTDPHKLHTLHEYQLRENTPVKNQGLDLYNLFQIPPAPHDFYGNKVPRGKGLEPGIAEIE